METNSEMVEATAPPAEQNETALPQTPAAINRIARALAAKPFRPHRLFQGGHAQTLAGYAWPRPRHLGADHHRDEMRLFEVEPEVRLLVHCRWQSGRRAHPTLVLVHGLEGSSESAYMLSTAFKAYRVGFNVLRLNMRNCGNTEHLTPTLYHSGMSGDLRAVVAELITRDRLPHISLVGVSMGGNLVLKLAGEYGEAVPHEVASICAISPSLDLSACADAIERRSNWIYQQTFVRSLRRRIRRKKRLYPELYDTRELRRVRTIRSFDERYTALHCGYANAADYYTRASALPLIPRIHVPTLIIHAQDDPFIPFASFLHPSLAANPYLLLITPLHGGHVGFVADDTDGEDRFWMENRAVEFSRLIYEEQTKETPPRNDESGSEFPSV